MINIIVWNPLFFYNKLLFVQFLND